MALRFTGLAALRRGARSGLFMLLVAASGAAACAGGEPRGKPPRDIPEPPKARVTAPLDAAVVVPIDAGPPVSEAVARQVIAARFRAAGFRVRLDVRLQRDGIDVTLDGYDPRREVGFEYVAPPEVDADMTAAERATLSRFASFVLVVDAGPLAVITKRVDAFLVVARRRLAPDAGVAVDASVAVDAAAPAQSAE